MTDLPFDPHASRVVLSLSGGKDSAAMALHLQELGITFEAVFCDTGWEHDATYGYICGELEPRFGPIRWLRSAKGGMIDWMNSKMMFPSRTIRWCTEELKVIPIRDYLAGLITEGGPPVVNAVGIRALESKSRAQLPALERWGADGRGKLDVTVWRPLIGWTEEDVIGIHRRHGLPPNPLYLLGATRVGCWPCIHARKHEIAMVAKHTPERIDTIRAMEEKLTAWAPAKSRVRATTPWPDGLVGLDEMAALEAAAAARVTAAGSALLTARMGRDEAAVILAEHELRKACDEVDRLDTAHEVAVVEAELRDPEHWRQTRTFFGIGEKGRGMSSFIDSIVTWAKTARGGKQGLLFEDDLLDNSARDGCMRWGMCETETPETLRGIEEPRR